MMKNIEVVKYFYAMCLLVCLVNHTHIIQSSYEYVLDGYSGDKELTQEEKENVDQFSKFTRCTASYSMYRFDQPGNNRWEESQLDMPCTLAIKLLRKTHTVNFQLTQLRVRTHLVREDATHQSEIVLNPPNRIVYPKQGARMIERLLLSLRKHAGDES